MLLGLLFTFIVSLVSLIFSPLPTVTELPFGIDDILTYAVSTFRAVGEVLPILVIPFSTVLFAYGLIFSFWVWDHTKWLVAVLFWWGVLWFFYTLFS